MQKEAMGMRLANAVRGNVGKPQMAPIKPGEEVVHIHISEIDYIWAGKPGQLHPEIVGWYNEFENLLREEKWDAPLTAFTAHSRRMRGYLWDSIKKLYRDMGEEMKNKGSSCIIDGMRDPLHVIRVPVGIYLPRMGNQRLCVLRSRDYGNPDCGCHGGMVPVVVMTK